MATFSELTGTLLDIELRNDDSTIRFTTARREAAVNEGYREFADLTECWIRQSTVLCSCNTTEYALGSSAVQSTDFVRFAAQGAEYHLRSSGGALRTVAGDQFPRRDIEWLNRYEPGWRESTTPVELPDSYYIRFDGGQYLLGLKTPPDVGSSDVASVLLPYVARPADMTSSTDVPFTRNGNTRVDLIPFHRALVHWAAHQLEKLRGDDDASDRQLAKFQSYVERFKEKARPKTGGVITLVRSYLREARRNNPSAHRAGDFYRDFE